MKYVPILKAKQGELRALREWDAARRPWVSPIVEITPWERGENEDADPSLESRQIDLVTDRIAQAWQNNSLPLIVDAAYAEPDLIEEDQSWKSTSPVLGRILEGLQQRQIRAAPSIRASAEPDYSESVGQTLADGEIGTAVVRITAEDLDDTVVPLRTLVGRTAAALGLPPNAVSILLDFGAVQDEGAMMLAARLARFVLPQLEDESWSSIAVAAGAFPVNLSQVQAFEFARIPRWDLRLWESLDRFELGSGRQLDYGDYGVTHPVLPIGTAFAAPPQLRYATRDSWAVMKGKRQERRGHAQFYDICRDVLREVGQASIPAEASYGDWYIHQAALTAVHPDEPPRVGTGNASTWRAIATSHHLAYTADQLHGEGGA